MGRHLDEVETMSTGDQEGKGNKHNKHGLQHAVEGILERLREDLQGVLEGLNPPRPQPVPIPVPVPVYRRRRG